MKKVLPVILFIFLNIQAIQSSDKLYVFSAASTTDLVNKLIQDFKEIHKNEFLIKSSFASSSTLARQIAAGAPADIFISANEKWMDWLVTQKQIEEDTIGIFARNELVLITSHPNLQSFKIESLPLMLKNDFLALGNYSHVPAGIYAKESLEYLNLWSFIKNNLALFPDVRSAFNTVRNKQAYFGIVYATDVAFDTRVDIIYTFPTESHKPIIYPIGIVKGRKRKASLDFLNFLKTDYAKDILKIHKFIEP
ncbi:MAG: molybdate ABC transporter substrate-binding protein [Leptospiraceae bacterium]|nr:molybdate ABC transporter substrate-binding protein [Leptospiraceae bacterium]MCP5497115.1 molybdate ABC transporter substrate-binding protein [Leptospiraceae bacterium]